MPAKDKYHGNVKAALVKDGWTITHDSLRLPWGSRDMFVDLGAEKFIGAEKGDKKIAVEVKSFIGPSDIHNLEVALGQYILYLDVLSELEPNRELYLAVNQETWETVFQEPTGKLLIDKKRMKLLIFRETEEIVQWVL
jgi:hypothetical protein